MKYTKENVNVSFVGIETMATFLLYKLKRFTLFNT